MNNNGKIPKWILIMVIGMVLTLLGMLWTSTVKGLSQTDTEFKVQIDAFRESSAVLRVNIAEINGRLTNIERALGIVDGFKKK